MLNLKEIHTKNCHLWPKRSSRFVVEKKKTNINIIVVNEIKKKYVYLQLKRKINCLRDLAFNVLLLNVEFDA